MELLTNVSWLLVCLTLLGFWARSGYRSGRWGMRSKLALPALFLLLLPAISASNELHTDLLKVDDIALQQLCAETDEVPDLTRANEVVVSDEKEFLDGSDFQPSQVCVGAPRTCNGFRRPPPNWVPV